MTKIHNGSKYTLAFVDVPKLSRSSVELLEKNATAAIEYLADNIRWKGVLDFVVRWDKTNLFRETWLPPAESDFSAGPGFAAYGNPLFGGLAGLTEALTGDDMNGPEFDAGMWVDPENVSISSYGTELYIDPDPNPLEDDVENSDFLSTFLHEILHSLGFWSTMQFKNTEYDYGGYTDYPTKFDSLTIQIGDNWFFNGKKTKELHGGPLPLALTERAHYSDSLEINFDLMREYGLEQKWQISDIDLAILFDLGHDVIKWSSERETEPEPTPESEPELNDGIIKSVRGKGKLKGTDVADAFTFDSLDVFTKKGADKIIGFNSSQGDSIVISPEAFPALQGSSEINFASTKKKKELKLLSKQDYDFVYFEKKGRLYYDGNGAEKNWGNKDEGGLVAVLKGKPELTVNDFIVLA